MGKKKYNRNTTRKVASVCDLSAALVSALKNKKGDAAISAAAEKNKKEDARLANIGNGLIAPRSQLGFGTVPWVPWSYIAAEGEQPLHNCLQSSTAPAPNFDGDACQDCRRDDTIGQGRLDCPAEAASPNGPCITTQS